MKPVLDFLYRRRWVVVCGGLLGALPGCGPVEAVDRGRDLFADPRLSVSPSNVFACATCHSSSATVDSSQRYPGYSMAGAAQRPSYWGGGWVALLDAVNFCSTQFMRGAQLAPDDSNGLALLAYLRALSPTAAPALPLSIVLNIDPSYLAALPSGDGGRGQTLYRATCAPCHGDLHSGRGRLGPNVSLVPDDTIASFGSQARAVIIEKIRHGRFFGIGGNMPLYSKESLSDAELADLMTYVSP